MFGLTPPLKHLAEVEYVSQVSLRQIRVKTAMDLYVTKSMASLRKHEWQTMQNARGNVFADVLGVFFLQYYSSVFVWVCVATTEIKEIERYLSAIGCRRHGPFC